MDRVLLVIDDIQYSRHVEMTLRKVGFDVEAINNEFNMAESILTFNPDYIICRGHTNRLSAHSVGRKLKESSSKFLGKVLLIFPDGYKVTPEDLVTLRMDLMLFDPMSTLKLAMHLFSFSEQDFEFVKDKLLKFAITDNQFRNYEQTILKSAGKTLDSEIQIISSLDKMPQQAGGKSFTEQDEVQKAKEDIQFMSVNELLEEPTAVIPTEPTSEPAEPPIKRLIERPEAVPLFPQPEELTEEYKAKIKDELLTADQELPLRIDTYNHSTKEVEQDLSVGLKKRQTRKASNKLQIDLINEQKTDEKSEKKLQDEKIRYTAALFKKKS